MPPVQDLYTGCEKQGVNTDKETAVALLNAYIAVHTPNTSRNQGSDSNKSEKLTRPKITQGMPAESWSPSQAMGKLYKTGTDVPKEECGLQSIHCCGGSLSEQPARVDTNTAPKPEAEQVGLIQSQAVVPTGAGAVTDQKEMARDAVKGEAAVTKPGYRKQQAPASPANKTKLHTQTKRESCTVPFNQQVRGGSGQLRRHKLCRKRWKPPPQKQDTSDPKAETNEDETAKAEKAPTTCIPGNWSIPRRSTRAIKGRNKPRQLSRRARNSNVKVSTSGNIEVTMTQLKNGAAVVLNRHIFDPK